MLKKVVVLGIVLAGLFMLFGALLAQSNEIILTVAIQEWQADMLNERVLQGFYDTHPGVKVVPVSISGDESYYGFDTSDIEGTLDKAKAYFSRADIVMASDYTLTPLVSHAGYVLDLTPYVRSDSSGTDDFYPVALKTFEWENGLWALPASLRVSLITYSPDAFGNAGLPVPDSSWTLDQYLEAGRALTVKDDKGVITMPGFYGFEDRVLVRAMLGHGFYDDSTQPETPRLDDPEIVAMLDALDAYNKEMVGTDPANNTAMQNWDWSKIPMQMGGVWLLSGQNGQTPFVPVLLPGDSAIVSAEGFAISGGTQNPDLAYELLTYLTSNVEVTSRFYGDVPARKSLEGQTAENTFSAPTPKALNDLLPSILENGVPSSELRYGEYLGAARAKMGEDKSLTLTQALQQAQEQAVSDLKLADARRQDVVIAVSTPVPTPVLATNEIALKFLLQTNYSPLPNREGWDRLTKEFADADPDVGYVDLVTGFNDPMQALKTVDCAYTSYNTVPFIDLSLIQPLDGFIATDTTFDRSDVPAVIWPQVTRDEKIYGLPLTMTPLMMWYNPKAFEAAGAFPPQMGWTVSDFIDAVKMLKEAQPDKKPYTSQNYGNAPYLLMAAAMGGMVVDYSTYMPTYHLTDSKVIEALRQTLDLAKDGEMAYTELDTDTQGGFMMGGGGGGSDGPALYDAPGSVYDWKQVGTEDNPAIPVTYPRGKDTIPLSFTIGAAYITSQTPYADACYRWLSTLAQHPELFNEMPVHSTQATNESLIAQQGQYASDFYVGMFTLMNDPQAVFVPTGFSGTNTSVGASIADIWLNQAMDAYVLEKGDLEKVLTDSQTKIDDYRTCIADLPPYDITTAYDQAAWEKYYKPFTDCAISVDPALAPRFAPPADGQTGG